MAIRVEELVEPPEARIYRFPVEIARFPVEAARPLEVARPCRSRASRRRAQLHRRRAIARRRAGLGAVVVALSTVMLFAGGPSSVAPAGHRGAPRAVVVQPGQTLWSLAERYAGPGIDPRAYVDSILVLNGLDAPPEAGVRIRLPR